MNTPNPIEIWLNNVAYARSGSKTTEKYYRNSLTKFLKFTGKTAEEIEREYANPENDKYSLSLKYAKLVQAWIGHLRKQGYVDNSIRSYVASVRSFFKYSNFPIGFVPTRKNFHIIYHNRDLTKKEISHILSVSRPRDRAFYLVMAQSGLRPHTLCRLRLKHLEPDFSQGTNPCKIDVPSELAKGQYHSYFTFIGKEAVQALKDYLKKRPNITPISYVFTKHGTEKPVNPQGISAIFNYTVRKLREKGVLDFEQKQKGKPAEVRLYNLRKFFRKMSHQAGFEIVQFFMGHTVNAGVDEHYRPKDVEWYRKLYKEKAMPFLRIETATPSETEQVIKELREQIAEKDETLKNIQKRVSHLERVNVATLNAFVELAKTKDPEKMKVVIEWSKKMLEVLKSS